jgi:tRNA-splicing ligase RtcB
MDYLVFGTPDPGAIEQIERIALTADHVALMADHHLGYSMPIGGVAAYQDHVSPSGVGYDQGCGNKCVRLDIKGEEVRAEIPKLMDEIWNVISFGVGRKNNETVDHDLFDDLAWKIPIAGKFKQLARDQLGTVGSGNHYVNLFVDSQDRVWIGVHFGSRGFGHKLTTHFLEQGGGKDGLHEPATLIEASSSLGGEYLATHHLALRYAFAGRDWVCDRVAKILGGAVQEEVHNNHNDVKREQHFGKWFWVVRKGATPAFPGQRGFVGSSMAEPSVILEGVDSELSKQALYSTVHGAGRVMSRTEARGKSKWIKVDGSDEKQFVEIKPGKISREMMNEWVRKSGVELRGADTDESPHAYKRLDEVLAAHRGTVRVIETLFPVGVAMASKDVVDPYKD